MLSSVWPPVWEPEPLSRKSCKLGGIHLGWMNGLGFWGLGFDDDAVEARIVASIIPHAS